MPDFNSINNTKRNGTMLTLTSSISKISKIIKFISNDLVSNWRTQIYIAISDGLWVRYILRFTIQSAGQSMRCGYWSWSHLFLLFVKFKVSELICSIFVECKNKCIFKCSADFIHRTKFHQRFKVRCPNVIQNETHFVELLNWQDQKSCTEVQSQFVPVCVGLLNQIAYSSRKIQPKIFVLIKHNIWQTVESWKW